MIKKIIIKNCASFGEKEQSIDDLKKINFFYGSNGSGKTTLSRVIQNHEQDSDCQLFWEANRPVKTFVYNRDFIDKNFSTNQELAGIFTLGVNDTNIQAAIVKAKKEQEDIRTKINKKIKTLEGDNDTDGKTEELKTLESLFEKECWEYYRKFKKNFNVLLGCGNSKEKFKIALLNAAEKNTADLLPSDTLKEKAKTIFDDKRKTEEIIRPILYNDLTDLENADILSKKVIGKEDVNIASMIRKLGNSDWVKQGRTYYELDDKQHCPFCQQKTDDLFAESLEEYFNEEYSNDIFAIETLTTNYDKFSDTVIQNINEILKADPKYLNSEKFKAHKATFEAQVAENKQHLVRKKKEASTIVKLESLKNIMEKIVAEITYANIKSQEHNTTIENIKQEKETLVSQIWRAIIEEIKPNYNIYSKKKNGLKEAITNLTTDLEKLKSDEQNKLEEIHSLEKQITSIKPTIIEINKLLLSFGFSSFSLLESAENGFYKIARPNGEDVERTLSEGEKTFITFLYFYYLLKGSNTESGITENRVVVFDDPVSSLDSDILFIVSRLIKNLYDAVEKQSGTIKQIFVLTHNVYFHKEVTFNKKRSDKDPLKNETFWIVKKHNNHSVVCRQDKNPIKTSYELLWNEIRDRDQKFSNQTLPNVMRRIIENYFKFFGNIDEDKILDYFDGNEKVICSSLISWVNSESHSMFDDINISSNKNTIDKYCQVFKSIFEKSGQIGHYNMMMRIKDNEPLTEHVEEKTQLLEV
jgi:wobble nucleotide-excising tRNase